MQKLKYKNKTTENFIDEAIKRHGDKYDYSLVEYINAKTKVKIICSTHGEFEQTPRYHINGQNCPKCSGRNKTSEEVVNNFIRIHGNIFDYSKTKYINSLTPVNIICVKHGLFKQRPKDHLLGKKCPKCSNSYMDTDYFIEKAKNKHNNFFSYEKTIFKKTTIKTIITCPKHGDFEQTPNSHLNGSGCPVCKESKGEKEIRQYLTENKVNYLPQHKFPECKNKKELPFDFYLPDYNTCIEFNGEQHYKPFKYFGGEIKFNKTQQNDLIKFNYCKDNNINLIIFNDTKKIKELLNKLHP